jgi:signal transduction histidine kinase
VVHYIAGDSEGNLWLSEQENLLHLMNGRLVEQIPWSELGRQQRASTLLAERGGVWLGFWTDGAVSYLKDRQLRASYTAADGLGQPPVQHLQLDRDGGLWAATLNGGLSRIKDGHIATLTSRNGLPCDGTNWTIDDDEGSLWLYMRCGLVRITRPEVDAWIADPKHRVGTTVWDSADGVRLRSSAAGEYAPRVVKSADGKLWFVTGEGIQVVDPRHLVVNKIPPPVRIEQITVDRKSYDTARDLRLPPLVRDLRLDFTALSLAAAEKVRFRYKLEGYDHDWQEAGNRRQAFYTNLPPRSYRFRVIAANNSGVWNERGDVLEFSVAPAYYQTAWFRALCAAGGLGLLWAGYQVRVRQLRHRFEMALEARVSERTRIARDLHDTLLQSFHGLLLRFQTVSQLWAQRPELAKEKLDGAIDAAARAITEGRNAVQGLRQSTAGTSDIVDAINTLGTELAAARGDRQAPAFRVTAEGEPRPLHPIVRDDIYKITAEALRNAFRHAEAASVDVEIRYDRQQFRLRVQDDGKGFDDALLPRQLAAGHYGVPGMRERAALMGGTLTVWSKEGAGTAVELCVPSRSAYVKTRAV